MNSDHVSTTKFDQMIKIGLLGLCHHHHHHLDTAAFRGDHYRLLVKVKMLVKVQEIVQEGERMIGKVKER